MSRLLNDLFNLSGKSNKAISYYNLALTSITQKNYQSAISSFLKALKENKAPQFQAMVRPNLGQAYVMDGQFEKGIEELMKSSDLQSTNEGHSFIHANLGYAYCQLKNYGLAIMEYRKALRYSQNDPKVHYALATLYQTKFQSNLAYAELEKALKLDPNNETYKTAINTLDRTPALSLKVGMSATPLSSLGIIITPSYVEKDKVYYPLIIYIYPESPLKGLAREGDYITNIDNPVEGKSLLEQLDVPPYNKLGITINKSKVFINSIEKITRKLNESEKIKLYHNWFNSFDSRIVAIWQMQSAEEKEETGAKWGYEFESLIRSWSRYQNDPGFNEAFTLLMEFFHAFIFGEKEDEVHYEINLSKLNFECVNPTIVNFFRGVGFIETAKHLENKIMVTKTRDKFSSTKKARPIKTNMPDVKKGHL
jgi:tetratricopeptide (TPR) repeat protein